MQSGFKRDCAHVVEADPPPPAADVDGVPPQDAAPATLIIRTDQRQRLISINVFDFCGIKVTIDACSCHGNGTCLKS